MRYVSGDRIGRTAQILIGCSAMVFDPGRERILLTRRSDNGRWCLPAGRMEAGESPEEAAIRETLEETGLTIEITRLVGLYSSPHVVSEYQDGNRYQVVGLCFEGRVVGGEMTTTEEATEVEVISVDQLAEFDIVEPHRALIDHVLSGDRDSFFRFHFPVGTA